MKYCTYPSSPSSLRSENTLDKDALVNRLASLTRASVPTLSIEPTFPSHPTTTLPLKHYQSILLTVSSKASNQQAMATSSPSVKRAFRHDPRSHTAIVHRPTLPTTIQTSLLSVGMRIRKSVSDGYQNSAKPSKSLQPTTAAQSNGSCRQNLRPLGLMPYCGILRTGNLQQEQSYDEPDQDEVPALDWDLDGYPSSQESTSAIPHQRLIKAPGKRCYDDEDSDSISHPDPLGSHPLQNVKLSHPDALRPILQPKTRRFSRMLPIKETHDSCTIMDIDDFEDATFLRFEDCMEQENEFV